ncbi:CAP domain-containing protein [Kitasatospora sp. GAS204B]|uniref:CAP domain-containing protein n=1 Tax=unclassified Kitasatospora TaxID=2633591 RepID=UPI002476BA02|nr:CAP domain-containing protein [Kitasatospora sp. GAS204B]MDH6122695.1 hypothetical protein [Kitasatospora sp. GAS204B]
MSSRIRLTAAGLGIAAVLPALSLPAQGAHAEPDDRTGAIAVHNTERASVPAVVNESSRAPLPALRESLTLDAQAQAWADSLALRDGGLVHSTQTQRTVAYADSEGRTVTGYTGENLAYFTVTVTADDANGTAEVAATRRRVMTEAAERWAAEKSAYALLLEADSGRFPTAAQLREANSTLNGEVGHYTQMVWRATTSIGIAVAEAPVKGTTVSDTCSPRGSTGCPADGHLQAPGQLYQWYVVARYGPGGNISGDKPY